MPTIDLFLVAGQSNAEGRGTSAQSPAVSNGSLMYVGSSLLDLEDPVGGASTGSAWPAFANAYGQCAITEAASGGSNLIGGLGGGTWATSGTLFNSSITQVEAAVTALETAAWTVNLRGVLWSQGESEALLYEGSDLVATYIDAMVDLLDRFRTELGAVDIWVARTGRLSSGDTDLWAEVRVAQDTVCASTEGLHMAYTDTVNFPDYGWMKVDGIHYNQTGLNAMGTAMGAHILADTPTDASTLVDVAGDPLVEYELVGGVATLFTDFTRSI